MFRRPHIVRNDHRHPQFRRRNLAQPQNERDDKQRLPCDDRAEAAIENNLVHLYPIKAKHSFMPEIPDASDIA